MSAGPVIGGWLIEILGFSQGLLLFGILMLMTWVAILFYIIGQRKFLAKQNNRENSIISYSAIC
jgi:hypothetical protein